MKPIQWLYFEVKYFPATCRLLWQFRIRPVLLAVRHPTITWQGMQSHDRAAVVLFPVLLVLGCLLGIYEYRQQGERDKSIADRNASIIAFHAAGGATLTEAEWDWCDRAVGEAWKHELAWQDSPEGHRYHEQEFDALSLAVKSGDWNDVDTLGSEHGGGIGLVHAISLLTAWKKDHRDVPVDLLTAVKEMRPKRWDTRVPDGSLEGPKLPDGANVLAGLFGREISRNRLGKAAFYGQTPR